MTITKLLTTAEVAERLRCSEAKVKRLRLAGHLAYLPGRPVRIPESTVEDFIRTGIVKAPSPTQLAEQRRIARKLAGPTAADMRALCQKNLQRRKALAERKRKDAEKLAAKKAGK